MAVRTIGFAMLLFLSGVSTAVAQDRDATGIYAFDSSTLEGDPFSGTIFVWREGAELGGRVFTTLDAPFAITGVRWLGESELGVRFNLGPGRVTFRLNLDGDRFTGAYTFEQGEQKLTREVTGRHRRTERNDLPPTRCVVPGPGFEVRCAMLHVPEDRHNPTGRWIRLNIVILPAESEQESTDAMFALAGGPGQAATEIAGGYAQSMAEIRKHRDVVLVDQRGTGRSNPLRCDFDDPNARAALLLSWRFPPGAMAGCGAELAERADVRFYHTAVAMADLDAVRQWLGYDRVNLYGGSYGTRAALTYLRMYPERTRTVTLRAVIAPSGALPLDNPADAQASLDTIFAECRERPACHAAYPDLERDLETVLKRLAEDPVPVHVFDPLARDTAAITLDHAVFAGALRRLLMNGDAIPQIPLVVHRAAAGDYDRLLPGISATLGISRSLYLGMGFSVVCTEDAERIAAANIEARSGGTFIGPNPARALVAACEDWSKGVPPDGYDQPVVEAVPVLILSGYYDPTTPVRWGREVARALPQSTHLIMRNVAHSPFPPCATEMMTRLVELGRLEGVGNPCEGVLEPPVYVVPQP